jgi:hypothetical protein
MVKKNECYITNREEMNDLLLSVDNAILILENMKQGEQITLDNYGDEEYNQVLNVCKKCGLVSKDAEIWQFKNDQGNFSSDRITQVMEYLVDFKEMVSDNEIRNELKDAEKVVVVNSNTGVKVLLDENLNFSPLKKTNNTIKTSEEDKFFDKIDQETFFRVNPNANAKNNTINDTIKEKKDLKNSAEFKRAMRFIRAR